MKLKAVGTRVMVKPDPIEKQTKSGIIVAVDEKRERAGTQKGTVLGVGPSAWKNELYGYGYPGWEAWCKVGDRILFPRYAGKLVCVNDGPDVPDDKREYVLFINDEDVQSVIEEE
jgi:co-chaperonin GroES (HSP10)